MSLAVRDKAASELLTFDHLKIPALLIDKDLIIRSSNTCADQVFQSEPGTLIGSNILDLITFPTSTKETFHVNVSSGQTSQAHIFDEAVCMRKTGESFFSRITVIHGAYDKMSLVAVQDLSAEKKLLRKASQRAKGLSIFNTLAGILNGHTKVGPIIGRTIEMLVPLMNGDAGWVYLCDGDSGPLMLAGQYGLPDEYVQRAGSIKPSECFSGKVFASGRPLLVKDTANDPRVVHELQGIRSIAGVPLTSKGSTLGMLAIASRKVSFFGAMDIQLLAAIGSQLGVAIENARLIEQLQEQMKHIELINELSSIINSSLSIGTVFRIMVSEIRKLIDYDRASLLLFDEKDDKFLIFALDTGMKTNLRKGMRAPIEKTSAGWVVKNNRPWINYDLRKNEFALDRKLLAEGILSSVSIPLYHDKILGVFNLDSTAPYKYSEKDLQILLPAAKHMSIALENALLFEEISREKKEWEKTFDAITDMVWIEDGRQRVIRANKTLLSVTGFSAMEITGRLCWEVLDKIGISPIECLCSDTIANNCPSFRELRGSGGSIFHFWAYPLIDENGDIYAIVHYLKDVTSRRRLEYQLIRSDRLASLGTLVAGIAHEVNNPLGIIAGYSEALLDRSRDKSLTGLPAFEDFPEYLSTIHNEIFRCKGILGSLLDFARPSSGMFREIDINELIKEVILLVNHKAKRLNHNIELKLNRDLPKIQADPGSLRQVFMNIIINSIYFTPEKGTIVITTDLADVGAAKGILEQRVAVSVKDSGKGISSDIIDKVFDPFFTTKPVGEGTGLGLAICHKIIDEHGGTIDVESEEGAGSEFIIRLPVHARND